MSPLERIKNYGVSKIYIFAIRDDMICTQTEIDGTFLVRMPKERDYHRPFSSKSDV
jgi:hypothetical protein